MGSDVTKGRCLTGFGPRPSGSPIGSFTKEIIPNRPTESVFINWSQGGTEEEDKGGLMQKSNL